MKNYLRFVCTSNCVNSFSASRIRHTFSYTGGFVMNESNHSIDLLTRIIAINSMFKNPKLNTKHLAKVDHFFFYRKKF